MIFIHNIEVHVAVDMFAMFVTASTKYESAKYWDQRKIMQSLDHPDLIVMYRFQTRGPGYFSIVLHYGLGADSMFAPSQWETALFCNYVSHWPVVCYHLSLANLAV